MSLPKFEIEKLLPLYEQGVWLAEFVVRYADPINGLDTGQSARFGVRFAYDESQSVTGLIEAAYEKAKEVAAKFASIVASSTISEQRASFQKYHADANKPFEIDWSSIDPTAS